MDFLSEENEIPFEGKKEGVSKSGIGTQTTQIEQMNADSFLLIYT